MMTTLKLFQIRDTEKLQSFSEIYFSCSGLPIPDEYLFNQQNRVFGIYRNNEIIGGFILGKGTEYRTLEVFAGDNERRNLYEGLDQKLMPTEICCFWIKREYRTKTLANLYVWLCMAYALKRYGTPYFLFGTCSRSLAKLYSSTPKSILIHTDHIRHKDTFIFWAKRSTCISGVLEIIRFKLNRVFKISSLNLWVNTNLSFR
ncbi:MAG: hypothetical protein H6576_08820 [Lewinellaceae bacterium]|nr:hypothetical protein [Saprospiraceae bacterium]MCB9343786.1 hypothetical protein [Lewinellaceae bacterium]